MHARARLYFHTSYTTGASNQSWFQAPLSIYRPGGGGGQRGRAARRCPHCQLRVEKDDGWAREEQGGMEMPRRHQVSAAWATGSGAHSEDRKDGAGQRYRRGRVSQGWRQRAWGSRRHDSHTIMIQMALNRCSPRGRGKTRNLPHPQWCGRVSDSLFVVEETMRVL